MTNEQIGRSAIVSIALAGYWSDFAPKARAYDHGVISWAEYRNCAINFALTNDIEILTDPTPDQRRAARAIVSRV